MTITVLMPVHDTPVEMLDRAIGSILAQTFGDFEFLILDDGGASLQVRSHLHACAASDARIRLIEGPHRGLTPTLNRGLGLAQGELIARQDADDWSEPLRLETLKAFLDRHPGIALVGSGAWVHQRDETPLWRVSSPLAAPELLRALPRGNPFFHGSVMFRRDCALSLGGYREQMPCSQDYDFFWRLAEAGGAANLGAALYHYRYSSGAVTASRSFEQAKSHLAARYLAQARRKGEPEDVPAALTAAAAQLNAAGGEFRAALKQADHLMLAGDYAASARAFWSLIKSRPGNIWGWAKLLRLAVFRSVPALRQTCFHREALCP